MDDRDRWEKLVDGSLAATQASAEKWRTGLSAFVTLVTGGLLVKGPEAAQDLPVSWRAVLSVLAGLGLGAAVVGLWKALQAAAGSPSRANLQDVIAEYGGVRQFEVVSARAAAGELAWARRLVGFALFVLGTAVLVWWWAPATPANLISVERTNDQATLCGELTSADGQTVRLQRDGASRVNVIPFSEVTNFRVVATC
ncbi:MAG: hypothetical protein KDB24_15765 [Microthrixaceae bacterium]|nr:hypothetical protein [Microthrixaceae bacterium]